MADRRSRTLPQPAEVGTRAPMAKLGDLEQVLSNLFEAERRVRKLHRELGDADQTVLTTLIGSAVEKALGENDEDEATLRLERLSMLLGEMEGPRVVDLLIDILAADIEDARLAAGEQLEGLAFERFKEVAKGIERALKRLPANSPALPELPYLLAEVPEPGVIKLLELFLAHENPDAVAAAIEVAVEIGDPAITKHIERLVEDERTVEMSDENDESAEVSLGELAEDALALLSEDEGEDEEGQEASDVELAPAPAPEPVKANGDHSARAGKKKKH